MKKLAIGAVSVGALAAAGALATSYYVGEQVQQSMEQAAQSLSSGSSLQVQLLDYQRGIITSQATSLWSIAAEEDSYEIVCEHDIVQGPWAMGKAAKVTSRFVLPEGSDPALVEALQQRAPLEWVAVADWTGASSNRMHSPAFEAKFEDGSTLSWGGMQMEWEMNAQLNQTRGVMRMPALRAEEQEGSRLEVEQVELTFDAHIPPGYSFWLGQTQMQIGQLLVQETADSESDTFSLQGIALSSSSRLEHEALQSEMDMHIQQLSSPSFSTKNIVMQTSASNIDAAWFERWMRWMQEEPSTDEQLEQLIADLPQLLSAQPKLRIQRLSMDSEQGPAGLSASLRYVGRDVQTFDPSTDLQGQLEVGMPLSLLQRVIAERVRSDYADLLDQMEQDLDEGELQAAIDDGVSKRLDALMEHGVLQREGDTVRMQLSFDQGAFRLNDRPQTLQQLLSLGRLL